MRSVVITGAYGGMGKAVTALLAERGYRVFALDLHVDKPQDGIFPIQADIADPKSIKAAFCRVREQTDRLYAVLHFAGVYMLDSLAEMSSAEFDRIWNINLRGAFLVNQTFLPLLERGSRILITTSELAPLDPLPFTGIYAVTKSALDKYAYSLRMELQLLGIDVSVLRAGAVQTDMLGVSTDALDRFCAKTALYSCNAARFKNIVRRVEARCVPPQKIAKKVARIIEKGRPSFAYSINRNPFLLMLDCLPKTVRFWLIRLLLR